MAKKVKRKKIRIKRVLISIVLLIGLFYIIIMLSKMPVKGYFISGNTYYSDQEILEKTNLDKYPSFLLTTNSKVNSKIKNDKLIDNIEIKKTLLGRFNIIVNEKKILFYDSNRKKSITESGEEVDYYDPNSPVLTDASLKKKIYKKLIEKMKKIDSNILYSISEIKYAPNDIDEERFLASMNDGNYIYLTLSKFSKINDYIKISRSIGDKNGILYLDYGNYFVPR